MVRSATSSPPTSSTLGRVVSQVAIKIITPESNEQHQDVLTEVLGLARFTHDYVIAYRSSGEVREGPMAGSLFLATELGDTSLSRLVKAGQRLNEDELRDLVRGVASALRHIHVEGAVHGDVKPANIFRVKARWKLGDLGLMKTARVKPTGPTHGSLNYLAPEMLAHEFIPANDVYGLGVSILHYFTGKYAHGGASREEFTENLKTQPASVPEYLREPWRWLVTRCLQRHPGDRPTTAQIESIVAPGSSHFPPADPTRPTLVVSSAGHGQYTSIKAAIAAAPPGARILVQPGKYRDSLKIDKSLEVSGDGPPDDVVISNARPALSGDHDRTAGAGARTDDAGEAGPAGAGVLRRRCGAGKPVIKDCSIHSDTLACVAIHDGADPHLKRCTIFGSRDAGVFVYDGGKGIFESCSINGHGAAGVTVTEGGNPRFAKCRIIDNKAGGAAIFGGGCATFEECEITGNGKAAVTVAGDTAIRNSRLTDNDGEAVSLKEGARAEVTGCDLRRNVHGPWRLPKWHDLQHRGNLEA